MGALFDYFAALSDEMAAGTIDELGGPAAGPQPFKTVSIKGMDPVVSRRGSPR
jgi:hypothetical protein